MNVSAREAARRTLDQRRSRALIEQAERVEEIARKIPQVIDLRKELALTSVKLSKMILAHDKDMPDGLEKLRNANLAMQAMERELLQKSGYPADYLEVHYTCPRCHDTGFVEGKVCDCFRQLEKSYILKMLNESSTLELCDFRSFQLGYYDSQPDPSAGDVSPRSHMTQVYNYCVQYAENFSGSGKGLFFCGPTGLGKTHLSLAIARRVIERGFDVVYGTAQGFLSTIEEEHFRRERSQQTLQQLLDTDLLVLDDLGTEFSTPFSQSIVYELFNTRRKPLIVSSNLTIQELQDKYGQRIVSRLFAKCTYMRFLGKDIRQRLS
ncbi:MAG: ATP-binding protein [Candidatus Merdivicinus sp.]|jgi:DNA replication protein DnaC